MDLVLLDDLLELISVNALPLIVTEYHSLGHLLVLWVFLLKELFNTVAVDMEFLFVTGLFIAGNH